MAFSAHLKSNTDPNGNEVVNWGEMTELREMNDVAIAKSAPGAAPESGAEQTEAISQRLGEMHWQLQLLRVVRGPGPDDFNPQFVHVLVPNPLQMQFLLDEKEDRQKWAALAPGSTVKVAARLIINEPNKIVAKIRLDEGT
jgi:hypothetical protein